MLDLAFSLTLRPPLTLAVAETSSRLSPRPVGRRCVVTAASDTTVASCAGAARLLRTEPQVRLMVLSISNDYLSNFHVALKQESALVTAKAGVAIHLRMFGSLFAACRKVSVGM